MAGPSPIGVTGEEIRANRRRAAGLFALDGVVIGAVLGVVIGFVVGPIVGGAVAVVVAVGLALYMRRAATSMAIARLGAGPLDEGEDPGLENLVEGLCATFGLQLPALMVVDDPVPNSCALGPDPARAVLVVTSGLLDRLDLIEMEGVVAHELAHIKRHDTAVSVAALAALGPLRPLGGDRWLHSALGRGREYRADQIAVATVQYPPGLHDALKAMMAGPEPAPGSVFAAGAFARTRWLWIDPMVGHHADPAVPGQNDATSIRIAALGEW